MNWVRLVVVVAGCWLSGRRRKSEIPKKDRICRNSGAKRGRYHRSSSVRGVGCEEQEKTCTVVWSIDPQEGVEGARVLSSHDRNGGSYRKKTEVVKGYFSRA